LSAFSQTIYLPNAGVHTALTGTIDSGLAAANVHLTGGSITATNPSVGINGAAIPLDSTQIAGSDGTNLQPLSVNSSGVLALPQGASTSANQSTEITALGTINSTLGSPFQSGGSIGNTSFIATQATGTNLHVVVDSAPAPTGGATSALQTTGNSSLSSIDSKLGTLGQKTMAGSAPVTIASDQSAIPVTGTFWQATQPVSGTIQSKAPLNANASGTSSTVSTVQTLTAPANAVGFILMNNDTSTTNMRWAIGRAAAVGTGQQLQPGRSSDMVYYTGNVSIIAESGTCNFDIQWISQ
jgi:hypothetical protein